MRKFLYYNHDSLEYNIFKSNDVKIKIITWILKRIHNKLIEGHTIRIKVGLKVNSLKPKFNKPFWILTFDVNRNNIFYFYKELRYTIQSNKYKYEFIGKDVVYIAFDCTIIEE